RQVGRGHPARLGHGGRGARHLARRDARDLAISLRDRPARGGRLRVHGSGVPALPRRHGSAPPARAADRRALAAARRRRRGARRSLMGGRRLARPAPARRVLPVERRLLPHRRAAGRRRAGPRARCGRSRVRVPRRGRRERARTGRPRRGADPRRGRARVGGVPGAGAALLGGGLLMFDVRPTGSGEEFGDAVYAIGQYFGAPLTEERIERFSRVLPFERMHAAFDDGQIVGGAGAFPFELSVPGGELRCGGVTVVGVYPTHRRRGALRAMMDTQLRDIHERGEPIAALWASEETIYGRFGYGLASWCGEMHLPREWNAYARPFERQGQVRFVTPEE